MAVRKNSHRQTFVSVALFFAVAAAHVSAQQPLLSPRDSTQTIIAGKKIFVDYGKPSMRGRVIMGGLVPYDRWWRTGANEATTFKTEADLIIGDTILPKGNYTLYTLPSKTQWKLMINRQTGQWGTIYNPDLDFVRLPMKKRTIKRAVEKLMMTLDKNGSTGGTLRIVWERTELTVGFKVKNDGAKKQHSASGIRNAGAKK